MLFNSWIFIGVFLPLVVIGYKLLTDNGYRRHAIAFLTFVSLVFYGAWDSRFLPLLLLSLLMNFSFGKLIANAASKAGRKAWLFTGLTFNLGVLFFFKYTLFVQGVWQDMTGAGFGLAGIVLPIGLSFITFQKIAYIVDVYRGEKAQRDLLDFALFVTFFPQLIAGPIVHHQEVIPQFSKPQKSLFAENLAVGITIFVFGLAKKVIVADSLALVAKPVFDAAGRGLTPDLLSAWVGLLAYTLQIYFDFSGYSDMAIGLAAIFGIKLPVNFQSPYRATSVIEFWRRWHITLSRFLRDYLYVPLGGGHKGEARRYINVFVTMILGGVWHGAGWTFLLWGTIHGTLIVANHFWRKLNCSGCLPKILCWSMTFVLVMLAWVPFRANDLPTTWRYYTCLFGMGESSTQLLPPDSVEFFRQMVVHAAGLGSETVINPVAMLLILPLSLVMAIAMPNVQTIMGPAFPGLKSRGYSSDSVAALKNWIVFPTWSPTKTWSIVVAILAATCLLKFNNVSDFIYFQF